MPVARKVLMIVSWLFLLGIAVQFLLAGTGLPQLGGGDIEPHRLFGYSALQLPPFIMLAAAFLGRVPQPLLIMTAVLTVLSVVQPFWVSLFQGEFLASFHVLSGLFMAGLTHAIASRTSKLVRAEA